MPRLDETNARRRTDRGREAIRNSLEKFGAARSIVVDGNDVIRAGNGTFEEAEKLGIPVRVVETNGKELIAVKRNDWTDDDGKAYAILDNRSTDLSEWDTDQLKENFDSMSEELRSFTGFSDTEFKQMFPPEIEDVPADMDRADELQAEWKVERGQLWLIEGQRTHRLLCGDATSEEDVKLLLDANQPTCVFTDPPYGVSVGAKNRMLNSFQKAGRNLTSIESDDMRGVVSLRIDKPDHL